MRPLFSDLELVVFVSVVAQVFQVHWQYFLPATLYQVHEQGGIEMVCLQYLGSRHYSPKLSV